MEILLLSVTLYPVKMAKKAKTNLKKFKKLSTQFNRQQNYALYCEFLRLYVEICRFDTVSKSRK